MSVEIGRITRLFRYPIKSVGGEEIQSTRVTERGLLGDRLWAVEDENGKFGSGKSTRRFRQMDGLLEFRASYQGEKPMLVLPDGLALDSTSPEATEILCKRTGKTVSVQPEREISHFDEGAIHFITTCALALLEQVHGNRLDVRRFRANFILDTGNTPQHLESSWLGKQIAIGETLVIEPSYLMPRCVMVNMAQHNLSEDSQVLKSIAKIDPDVSFGAFAKVIRAGEIQVGATACLL